MFIHNTNKNTPFFQIQLEKYLESSSHLIFAILIYIGLFLSQSQAYLLFLFQKTSSLGSIVKCKESDFDSAKSGESMKNLKMLNESSTRVHLNWSN
jgi:hypothetical protein